MSARPEISTALNEGETLLWQGHPKPGRQTPFRASLFANLLYGVTMILGLIAWYLGVYQMHSPATKLIIYGLIATGTFATYWALKITWLNRRRARSRDARTAYAITDQRALTLAGPYAAEVPLAAGAGAEIVKIGKRGTLAQLVITGEKGTLTFDRLDDAGAARDILMAQTGSAT